YAQAAKNAITAGFNRIKIHAVNDYPIDQFLQDVSNERMNEYGESIKNCARFVLEIVAAVDNTTGEDGAIIHLSPWNTFQRDVHVSPSANLHLHPLTQLGDCHPSLAYVHFI
ncbi:hypothetical protein M422DRAFT_183494, partial [Sphaerobolus stellatus SS14]